MRKEGMVLEQARRIIPVEIEPASLSGFKNGDRVRLKRGKSLGSATFIAVQYFSTDDILEVIGQSEEGKIIVHFKGEDWEVDPKDLRLCKRKGK